MCCGIILAWVISIFILIVDEESKNFRLSSSTKIFFHTTFSPEAIPKVFSMNSLSNVENAFVHYRASCNKHSFRFCNFFLIEKNTWISFYLDRPITFLTFSWYYSHRNIIKVGDRSNCTQWVSSRLVKYFTVQKVLTGRK